MARTPFSPAFRLLTLFTLLLACCGGVAFYLPHLEAREASPLPLLRLHVVAPSDDPADQALKLKVRDAILAYVDPLLADCHSVEESRERVQEHLDEIQTRAAAVIREAGYDYAVTPEVGRFHFPAKVYGHLKAPAGEYEALRVVIGTGQGANWWCVLYPPLCLSDRTGAVAAESPSTVKAVNAIESVSPQDGETSGKLAVEVRSKLWDMINGIEKP
ncbi:stage II sporulation protein R [Heliobacterium gestii]|uniref:Stage II sporulation protein R n=1 Tax=Heliomicrobium gestii TaxID=2699 RepID=A0A845LBW2_HELGE|nr:stage II sporulation protein R [Heliomicrobium gestii]MBM7867759.1 stage II sporulation protein R [Heliomicrobium gestii]MZP44152.1 stage II sporulation protein R [Heliomicrobium gestii]